MIMAVMIADISRIIAIATRLAVKIPAPNILSCMMPTKAKIMPIRKLMRLTIGSAAAPAS